MLNKGLLIVVSGPSGVGKGTVLKEVFANDSNLVYSISCTTREPREGEQDGVEYYFISKKQFEENILNNKMLEYANYCDNYYGTSADYVNNLRSAGRDVVLEIDVQGALQVKEKCKDAIMIFIAPPSFSTLESRLRGRATESEEKINARVARAREEISLMSEYTYNVVNDTVEQASADVLAILKVERIKKNKINIL